MKKRERFIFSVMVLLCLTMPFVAINAFASGYISYSTYGHRFTDGKPTGTYTINANVTTAPCGSTYASLIKTAVSNWNSAGVGVNFSYTTNSEYKIYFTVGNFGNSGNTGKTQFFNSSGVNIGTSGSPSANYSYTIISLNNTHFQNDASTLGSANGVKAITAHEMGHALGLGHCVNVSNNPQGLKALMFSNIADKLITGEFTFCKPQTLDKNGVNAIY